MYSKFMKDWEKQDKPNFGDVPSVEDLALINKLSRTTMTIGDVYTFRVILCDNEIDKDFERFTAQTLVDLSTAFVGKAGVFDQSRRVDIARIYKTQLEVDSSVKTTDGHTYCRLWGYAFIPRTEWNAELIEAIESHEHREISVGCAVQRATCSICGGDIW